MKIIELPREALQSIPDYISPNDRAMYFNTLLKVGFDTVEIGSITSERVLPQMQGTFDVLEKLEPNANTNIMVLVLNKKGADTIIRHEKVTQLSFPFAASSAFLTKNINSTVDQTFETTAYIVNLCHQHHKKPIIYFSMAFGNPYGETWNLDMLMHWIEKLENIGIDVLPLSNVSIPIDEKIISEYYATLIPTFTKIEFGLHLHTKTTDVQSKINAAYLQSCRRFDAVINGMGGCPMACDEMLGNLETQALLRYFDDNNIPTGLDSIALNESYKQASQYLIHSIKK
ncbi:MAG: hydroxymethylglutaryl-CoA lyase [Bacteroidota bacterium]